MPTAFEIPGTPPPPEAAHAAKTHIEMEDECCVVKEQAMNGAGTAWTKATSSVASVKGCRRQAGVLASAPRQRELL